MNIFDEILKLPQYNYEWKSGHAVLGGVFCSEGGTGDKDIILEIWKELKSYYEKDKSEEGLSDSEKKEYAQAVKRMETYCRENVIDRDKLKQVIDALSKEDKKEIEWQIDMYKRGQSYSDEPVCKK